MTKLEHALAWAGRGYPVFRLVVNGKVPLKGSNGHLDATTDSDTIRELWGDCNYNIGVRPPVGCVIVDLDEKENRQGIKHYEELGGVVAGLIVRTPTGGLHVYTEGPDLRNSAGKLAEGVDTRGNDGYAVAPGSTIDGVPYEVIHDDFLFPCPDFIAEGIRRRGETVIKTSRVVVEDDRPENVDRFIRFCEGYPSADPGDWHDKLRNIACEAVRLAVSVENAVDVVLDRYIPRGRGFHEDGRDERWEADFQTSYRWGLEQGEHGIKSEHLSLEYMKARLKLAPEPTPEATDTGEIEIFPSRSWSEGRLLRALSPEYLIKGLIGPGGKMAVLGGPGCGKSVVLPELAFCVATGTKFMNKKIKRGRVLYFATEDSVGLERRLQVSGDFHGDPGEDWLRMFYTPMNLSKNPDLQTFYNTISMWNPDLIIIDTLFSGFPGVDVTDRAAEGGLAFITEFTDQMTKYPTKPVVAYGHHTPKTGEAAYGGQQIQAMFDTTLLVEGQLAEERTITIRKNRMGPDGEQFKFRIDSALLCVDDEGDEITAPLIRWSSTVNEQERAKAEGLDWVLSSKDGHSVAYRALCELTDAAVGNNLAEGLATRRSGVPLARIDRDDLKALMFTYGTFTEGEDPKIVESRLENFLKSIKKRTLIDFTNSHVWRT